MLTTYVMRYLTRNSNENPPETISAEAVRISISYVRVYDNIVG